MINACIIGFLGYSTVDDNLLTTAQSDVKEEIVDAAVTTRKGRKDL